jgi:hypothetical protein
VPGKYRFWPERPPGPLDEAYVQKRWLRPYRPGPFRLLASGVLVFVLMFVTLGGLLGSFAARGVLSLAVWVLVLAAVYAALVAVVVRCFLAGVWVTDHAVRVTRLLSTRVWRWTDITDVRSVPGPTRVLGLPVHMPGETVVLVLTGGDEVTTPVGSRSCDFLGRREAYEMASAAVEGWFQQAPHRRPGPGRGPRRPSLPT